MPAISNWIEDAVRNDHPIGPTWEVMIERLERLAAANTTCAKQLSLELFGLGIDRIIRIPGLFILFDQLRDAFKLSVTVG